MLNDKFYKILKWLSITAIPALVVFFETVLPVWDVSQKVITRCTTTTGAFGILIASCLMISNYNYTKSSKEDEEV